MRAGCLAIILFFFVVVPLLTRLGIFTSGSGASASLQSPLSMAESQQGPKLKVLSWSCSRESDFMLVQGEVQNITDKKMDNVEVVGTFRTKSGDLVKTAEAVLEYNPILPGQRSPFKALSTDNPAITNCNLSFKFLLGGDIDVDVAPPLIAEKKHKKQMTH